ncbi:MAG: hypothetical protein MSH08_04535 [Ezakiella sp.]|nr:hypothetical protein [Ezakiella sp.]MDD7472481.1 hypothetical protein [Bacillota bacterium]MDY3923276.1 hypothetical protein [Ezakiella sp.]
MKNDFVLFAKKKDGTINAMTCGWVTDGILFNKRVKMVFVRKSRYTYEFLQEADYFVTATLSDEAMQYYGSVSGRDEDKNKKMGVKFKIDGDRFEVVGAKDNLFMKKIAVLDFKKADYLDEEIKKQFREDTEAHVIFVGEIVDANHK